MSAGTSKQMYKAVLGCFAMFFIFPIVTTMLTGQQCSPPASTNLHVRLCPQEENNWCWAACAEMIMLKIGNVDILQCEQATKASAYADCCNVGCDDTGWPEFWRYGFNFTNFCE